MRPKIRTTQKIREIIAYYKGRNNGDANATASEIWRGPLATTFDSGDRYMYEVAVNILAKEARAAFYGKVSK